MILARLGLLKPDEFEKARPLITSPQTSQLSSLNSSDESFHELLRELDHLPTRCFDTAYVLYVKRSQHEARQILTNEVCEKYSWSRSRRASNNFLSCERVANSQIHDSGWPFLSLPLRVDYERLLMFEFCCENNWFSENSFFFI